MLTMASKPNHGRRGPKNNHAYDPMKLLDQALVASNQNTDLFHLDDGHLMRELSAEGFQKGGGRKKKGKKERHRNRAKRANAKNMNEGLKDELNATEDSGLGTDEIPEGEEFPQKNGRMKKGRNKTKNEEESSDTGVEAEKPKNEDDLDPDLGTENTGEELPMEAGEMAPPVKTKKKRKRRKKIRFDFISHLLRRNLTPVANRIMDYVRAGETDDFDSKAFKHELEMEMDYVRRKATEFGSLHWCLMEEFGEATLRKCLDIKFRLTLTVDPYYYQVPARFQVNQTWRAFMQDRALVGREQLYRFRDQLVEMRHGILNTCIPDPILKKPLNCVECKDIFLEVMNMGERAIPLYKWITEPSLNPTKPVGVDLCGRHDDIRAVDPEPDDEDDDDAEFDAWEARQLAMGRDLQTIWDDCPDGGYDCDLSLVVWPENEDKM